MKKGEIKGMSGGKRRESALDSMHRFYECRFSKKGLPKLSFKHPNGFLQLAYFIICIRRAYFIACFICFA